MSQLALLGGEPVRRNPFSPWPQYLPEDEERLVETFRSRRWGGYPVPSRHAAAFAEEFAAYHGARYGLPVTNGTIALTVALQAAGIRFGDEVIVPAYTWDGTATAILSAGGVPVFVDIDPDSYCMDPAAVRAAVTPRTRALLPVHLGMRFADMDAMLEVARAHHLLVIEDCAHAHGGQYRGRGAGSMGDAGCFSFQESKLMTAGEGGMVITSRLDIYEALQSLINCGRASGTDQFKRRVLGYNHRMTDLQAAILIGQLRMLPGLTERRTRHAARLTAALGNVPGIRALPAQAAVTREHMYHYVLQYRPERPGVSRDLFAAALEAEGVPCDGRFYEAVYRSDLFYATPEWAPQLAMGRDQPVDYTTVCCPVAERAAYEESLWLPQFLFIGEPADVDDVAAAIGKVAGSLEELAEAAPGLAGVKGMSRAERPKVETARRY